MFIGRCGGNYHPLDTKRLYSPGFPIRGVYPPENNFVPATIIITYRSGFSYLNSLLRLCNHRYKNQRRR